MAYKPQGRFAEFCEKERKKHLSEMLRADSAMRKRVDGTPEERAAVAAATKEFAEANLRHHRALNYEEHLGCPACSKTGYKGRMALHEVMNVTEDIERLAVQNAPATQIAEVARAEGMTTLRQDGMEKVALGYTSIDEILRVVV